MRRVGFGVAALVVATGCTSVLGDDFEFGGGSGGTGGSGGSSGAASGAAGDAGAAGQAAGASGASGTAGSPAGAAGQSGSSGSSGSPAGAAGSAGTGGTSGGAGGVSGSGGGAPLGPLHQSGTQLKMRWWEADGGVKVFSAVHDAKLDVDCIPTFGPGDGYCIPNVMGSIAYTDVDCKTPVALSFASNPAPKYVDVTPPGGSCGTPSKLMLKQAGAKIAKVPYYQKVNGVCALGTDQMAELYTLGADVPDADILPLKEVVETHGDLEVALHVGSDGSRIYKETRVVGAPPGAQAMTIGAAQRWVPNGVYIDNTQGPFEDASCKTIVAYSAGLCNLPVQPKYAVEYMEGGGCISIQVRSVGAQLTSQLYELAGATCQAKTSNPPAGFVYYHAGAVVDPTELPAVVTKLFSTGRLQDTRKVDANGLPIAFDGGYLYDKDLKTPCSPAQTKDAGLRCVPQLLASSSALIYSDAACSKAAMAYHPSCNVPTGSSNLFGTISTGVDPGDIYALGDPIPKTAYSKFGGTTCMPFTLGQDEELRPATLTPGTALAPIAPTVDP